MQKFVFLGFSPHKKGRETFFKEVAGFQIPVIYYDSVHRVIKNLELLESLNPEKNVILGRELTKMFEEIVRGTVPEVLRYFEENPGKIKGEFSIIVY
jgi:16S rRNA (cytidine1402-2'-O)-methyltransferase